MYPTRLSIDLSGWKGGGPAWGSQLLPYTFQEYGPRTFPEPTHRALQRLILSLVLCAGTASAPLCPPLEQKERHGCPSSFNMHGFCRPCSAPVTDGKLTQCGCIEEACCAGRDPSKTVSEFRLIHNPNLYLLIFFYLRSVFGEGRSANPSQNKFKSQTGLTARCITGMQDNWRDSGAEIICADCSS